MEDEVKEAEIAAALEKKRQEEAQKKADEDAKLAKE